MDFKLFIVLRKAVGTTTLFVILAKVSTYIQYQSGDVWCFMQLILNNGEHPTRLLKMEVGMHPPSGA